MNVIMVVDIVGEINNIVMMNNAECDD